MYVEANGAKLWFDVDGQSVVPGGPRMRSRPTVILVHGGPGGFDHSYFKPHFGRLTAHAQVIYLDLREHGRSSRHDVEDWTFEQCADDLRAFCDSLGIVKPIVLGHSMGGFVVMLYGARHPGHAAGLILESTMARFDLKRLTEGFRAVAGDEVAALAERDFGGDEVSEQESDRVFAAFGPRIPDQDALDRRVGNSAINPPGMQRIREFDVVSQLDCITCPTLVCVGDLDPVTPVSAAREIVDALAPGIGRLEIFPGAGHFLWLDSAEPHWAAITRMI